MLESCARKKGQCSTNAGLEQDFNSLDAQREACQAFIKSQVQEGWRRIKAKFDDGGCSGGSLERPALQALLDKIRDGKIDVVVVYKVDRLTRSLADFAKLVELFDTHVVSFVSVTQAFNTTTSMGRLTLNVLLSFAQFEREITGERIRDKIAASKKKGLWMGGMVPLGYRVESRRLMIEPAEAKTVRLIFARYTTLRSLPALQRELKEWGIVTRRRKLSSGKVRGGVPLTNGPLVSVLRNRTYLGEINHRGQSYPGEHQAFIAQELFDKVQGILDANRRGRRDHWQSSQALLVGKLYDDRGNRMTPTYAIKNGVRYRYYASCVLARGRKSEAGSVARVAAHDIENCVCKALQQHNACSESGAGTISISDRAAMHELIGTHVGRVTVSASEVTIDLAGAGIAEDGKGQIHIAWTPPRMRRCRHMILPDGRGDGNSSRQGMRAETRVRIIIAIAKARQWLNDLKSGKATSIGDIAQREKRSERSIRINLSLAFLAPDVVTAAIEGSLPRGVRLCDLTDPPQDWVEQRRAIGLSSTPS